MQPLVSITSAQNSKIKQIVQLASDASARKELKQAVLYGEHLILAALNYHYLDYVLLTDTAINRYASLIEQLQRANVIIYTAGAKIMVKCRATVCDSEIQLIGVMNIPTLNMAFVQSFTDLRMLTGIKRSGNIYDQDCVLIAGIQDPGNLGALFRSIAACGIKHVLLGTGTVDAYNPKVLRASQGLQLNLNVYQHVDLQRIIADYPCQTLATSAQAKTSIYQVDLTKPTAWLLGNEGAGIDSTLLKQVRQQVMIPLANNVESLNVSIAGSICFFEMLRQRQCKL